MVDAGSNPTSELIGYFQDSAVVRYTQDKSAYEGGEMTPITGPLFLNPGEEQPVAGSTEDADGSPARWEVTYETDSGARLFTLIDSTTSKAYDPMWSWSGDWLGGDGTVVDDRVADANGRNVRVQAAYLAENASLSNEQSDGAETIVVATVTPPEAYHARWYAMIDDGGNIIDPSASSRGPDFDTFALAQAKAVAMAGIVGWGGESFLATPRTAEQIAEVRNVNHNSEESWIGVTGKGTSTTDFTYILGDPTLTSDFNTWWKSSEPNKADGDQNYAVETKTDEKWNDEILGDNNHAIVQFEPYWDAATTDLEETFEHFKYDWSADAHDIYDPRLRSSYQWTSLDHDIWGYRPVYETHDVKTMVVQTKSITEWARQAITQEQSQLYSELRTIANELPTATFSANSVEAATVTITTGRDVTVSGLVAASSGALTITAGRDLTVEGKGGGEDFLAPLAHVSAPETLSLTAGRDLRTAETALVSTTSETVGTITVIAGRDIIGLGGTVTTASQVTVTAARNITLNGQVTASDAVTVTAGSPAPRPRTAPSPAPSAPACGSPAKAMTSFSPPVRSTETSCCWTRRCRRTIGLNWWL